MKDLKTYQKSKERAEKKISRSIFITEKQDAAIKAKDLNLSKLVRDFLDSVLFKSTKK